MDAFGGDGRTWKTPASDDRDRRERFLETLGPMNEGQREHLLSVESPTELAALWALAMSKKFTDLAAAIEVHANQRGHF